MNLKIVAFMAVLLVSGLMVSCSVHRSSVPVLTGDIELTSTPFFPQRENQCGPAAVAMILAESGLSVRPDMLSPELFIPKRQGTLQLEIIGTIRRHGRIPYRIQSDITTLISELRRGRPVLVLQNLGLKSWPAYHYSVVVGVLADGSVVLRSGLTRRLVIGLDEFLASWERAGQWGVVALAENELPADQDLQRFLNTIVDIEETGDTVLAKMGYTSVLTHYSDEETALFGLANTLYSQGLYKTAAICFARLLRRDPCNVPAANNLAESLAALHCYDQALELLDDSLCSGRGDPEEENLLTVTRKEILQREEMASQEIRMSCETKLLSDFLRDL